jgi:hypothetical protein
MNIQTSTICREISLLGRIESGGGNILLNLKRQQYMFFLGREKQS